VELGEGLACVEVGVLDRKDMGVVDAGMMHSRGKVGHKKSCSVAYAFKTAESSCAE
jgi:hypothetical protein